MASALKVAVITGGASGIGLAVAKRLVASKAWHVHLLDLNTAAGTSAISQLGPSSSFHPTDVSSYASLSASFTTIFAASHKIDFVFANAGIPESTNFYAPKTSSTTDVKILPPPPNTACIAVTLNGAINTCVVANHFFRHSPLEGPRALVITASCVSLYASGFLPIYTASKHGVLGFMRAIAKRYFENDGVRVNALLPGTVRTAMMGEEVWAKIPEEFYTPVETLVEGEAVGKALETSGFNVYSREQIEFSDECAAEVMGRSQ
ncbi:3-beta-hydroxysteroid dehydrogenase [Calycina marina]|uniref:3-beta-hydroxysteroid dehydrogenase n=1 Tax=Calycina marina TaxID=1763456 RepID=A0A9P8CBV4_9HELO|nr:3-beta-hydroxysteroid dehydrogenase [Calycina marina]